MSLGRKNDKLTEQIKHILDEREFLPKISASYLDKQPINLLHTDGQM